MTPFSEWKMISLSPKSKFEHRVGMPMPRLTIQPSSNSIASRSHICWRVRPFVASLIVCSSKKVSTQRSQRTRDGREDSEPVDQSNDTVAHSRNVEIQQKAEFE